MKACLAACLLCVLFCKAAYSIASLGVTPILARDFVVPVTTNSVRLQKPFCSFNSECDNPSQCQVWLVSSLTSAKAAYDADRLTGPSAPYPGAYTSSTGKKYSTLLVDTLDKIPCVGTQPYNVLVGKEPSTCSEPNCNGLLPEGENMSFKYVLVKNNGVVAETNWTENLTLRSAKNPDTLGSSYAGRSAAMVVITTILSVAAALLLLLLLFALIQVCCYRTKTTRSYETGHKPSVMGSLRVPSYDVHHLKNTSPYDNPAYEQNLKKRYTTSSTLPQATTTVITHHSPENVIVQRM